MKVENWRHKEIEIVWKEIIKVNVGTFIRGKKERKKEEKHLHL